jgi:4'-phosphopantetheinyl transferase
MTRSIDIPCAGQLDIWWGSLCKAPRGAREGGSDDVLKDVLARYGQDEPITRDVRGKPFIGDGIGFSFNLSHSEHAVVIAVADGAPVGVDCEAIRSIEETTAVAELTFCDRERAHLAATPAAARQSAFYSLWTRKEALVKAMGVGISYPLAAISVLAPEITTPAPVEAPGDGLWWVATVEAPAGYAAACACRRRFIVRSRTDTDGFFCSVMDG